MKIELRNTIEIGETRDKSGFLFFPKEILCDQESPSEKHRLIICDQEPLPEIRWMRFAKWRQIYVEGNNFDNAHWEDFRWLD